MRKLLTLTAFLLFGAVALSSQPLTPYEYGRNWFIAVEGGAQVFVGDYSSAFTKNHDGLRYFAPHAGGAIGYYFTDAHILRISGDYAIKQSVPNTYDGYYPYHFSSVNIFADYMLGFNALAEYNIAFNPMVYVGAGVGQTFGFSDPGHPSQTLHTYNILPGFRVGGILEYDFRNYVGIFMDLGLEFFPDRYNGQDRDSFPVDFTANLSFGVVWHIMRGRK